MHRDPKPAQPFDVDLQNTSFDSLLRKVHPNAHLAGEHHRAADGPPPGWSAPYGSYPRQEFSAPAPPPQAIDPRASGHMPTASWSGPDGAYDTPADAHPPRNAGDTKQTYTSPEMARGAGEHDGPSSGVGAGYSDPPHRRETAAQRAERFSMPVSDEELRATADIVNGTRTFVLPLGGGFGGLGGAPLSTFDIFDVPFPAHAGFPIHLVREKDEPWDKPASIHTIYSELPKESTPPMPDSPTKDRADFDTSRPPTVPPKDTPKASPKLAPFTPPENSQKTVVEEKEVAPAPAVTEQKPPKVTIQAPRTPRVSDLHLPIDPSTTPAIKLQAPTPTDQTVATATSRTESTPVTVPRSPSNSPQEQPRGEVSRSSSAARAHDSFVTAQGQPQLPAYQSQPNSPTETSIEQQAYTNEKRGTASPRRKKSGATGHTRKGSAGKARTKKKEAERASHSPVNNGQSSNGQNTTVPSAPSYRSDHVPRGVESMMSPETMTTAYSGRRDLKPPDYVTERLYAWAAEKSDHDFVETLERLSGGEEVSAGVLHCSSTN